MASQNTPNLFLASKTNMTDKQEMEEVRDVWMNLGYLLNKKNDFAGAEHAYKNALKLDPKYTDAWTNWGILLMNHKKDFAGAEHAFENALAIDPNHAKATNGMCACVLMMCECARKTPSKRHSKSTRN